MSHMDMPLTPMPLRWRLLGYGLLILLGILIGRAL